MVFGFILFLVLILTYILFKKYTRNNPLQLKDILVKILFVITSILLVFFSVKHFSILSKFFKNILINRTSTFYYFAKLKNFLKLNKTNILKVLPLKINDKVNNILNSIDTPSHIKNEENLLEQSEKKYNANFEYITKMVQNAPKLQTVIENNEFDYIVNMTDTEFDKLYKLLDEQKNFIEILKNGTDSNPFVLDYLNLGFCDLYTVKGVEDFLKTRVFNDEYLIVKLHTNVIETEFYKNFTDLTFDLDFTLDKLKLEKKNQISKFLSSDNIHIYYLFSREFVQLDLDSDIKELIECQNKAKAFNMAYELLLFYFQLNGNIQKNQKLIKNVAFIRKNNKRVQKFYNLFIDNINQLQKFNNELKVEDSNYTDESKNLIADIKMIEKKKKKTLKNSNNNNKPSKINSFFNFFYQTRLYSFFSNNFITNFFVKIGSFFFSSKKKSSVETNYINESNLKKTEFNNFKYENYKKKNLLINQILDCCEYAKTNAKNLNKQNYPIDNETNVDNKKDMKNYIERALKMDLNRIEPLTDFELKKASYLSVNLAVSLNSFDKSPLKFSSINTFKRVHKNYQEPGDVKHTNYQYIELFDDKIIDDSFFNLMISNRDLLKKKYKNYRNDNGNHSFYTDKQHEKYQRIKKEIDSGFDSEEELNSDKGSNINSDPEFNIKGKDEKSNKLLKKINLTKPKKRVRLLNKFRKSKNFTSSNQSERVSIPTPNNDTNKKSSSGKEEDPSKYA